MSGVAYAATTGLVGELLASSQASADGPLHVFLVTIDTIRADHLPMYGYPRNTAPFLDKLSKESVLFRRAVSSCSHTNPAHLSILSGLQPPQHKLHTNIEENFSPSVRLASQVFHEKGFATAACCSVRWLKVFERGFDHFVYYPNQRTAEDKTALYYPAATTVNHALAWLEQRTPEEPLFLWVHFFDPHRPLHAPAPHTAEMEIRTPEERSQLLDHWQKVQHKTLGEWKGNLDAFVAEHNAYDAEIHYLDAELERLYHWAQEHGLNQDSLWIITGDHGEGLGGHNYRDHGMYLYQEELLVPLLIHDGSGRFRPRVVEELVAHVDLVPTLGALYQWPEFVQPWSPTPGVGLLPLLEGKIDRWPVPRLCFAQRQHRYPQGYSTQWEPDPIYCLQSSQCKYIVHTNGQDECYDLSTDPGELVNVISKGNPCCLQMGALARAAFQTLTESAQDVAPPEFTGEYGEHLKALGYL
ncbi:MAG: sulfatase-like hydrolase/transferase [Candidatus Hydrogenedentes bacterium]|nr:sulfatase-like hydrolase/transferase [Candidatus Hydrogenedentota bacterium]